MIWLASACDLLILAVNTLTLKAATRRRRHTGEPGAVQHSSTGTGLKAQFTGRLYSFKYLNTEYLTKLLRRRRNVSVFDYFDGFTLDEICSFWILILACVG